MGMSLEFAPNTTEDCKRLVGAMFSPTKLLHEYREARKLLQTGDLVFVSAESDGEEYRVEGRVSYVVGLKNQAVAMHGDKKAAAIMQALAIAHQSAHKLVKLPFESEAFWLVIARRDAVPVMCVLFAVEYENEPVFLN